MTMTFEDPPEREDRSKYAPLFAKFQAGKGWDKWVKVDEVRGGGLASRLASGQYVGLRGLDYQVRVSWRGDGTVAVYLKVLDRKEK